MIRSHRHQFLDNAIQPLARHPVTVQFQRRTFVLTGRQCTDGHGRAAGGDENGYFPRLDPPVHLVNGRLQGSLDEGLQERASLRGDRIILDEIPLQAHRTHPRAGESAGIASIGKDQLRRSPTDVQQQVGTITEGHPREHPQVDQTGLLRATDEIHIDAKAILNALEKLPAIGSLADGAGGGGHDLLHVVTDGQIPEPSQCFESTIHSSRGQLAAVRIAFPKAGGRLLRQFDAERAKDGVHAGHQEMGGVGADVNGCHAPGLGRRPCGFRPCRSRWFRHSVQHRRPCPEVDPLCHPWALSPGAD